MAQARTSASDAAADRLLNVFRREGYAGASLTDLSASTGLGRSSLYHHFPGGKEDMARAVLDRVDLWLEDAVVGPLQGEGTPEARLARFAAAIDAFYEGGRAPCILGAFAVGPGRERFGPRLASAFERMIAGLAAVARDSGAPAKDARLRAERVVVSVQGALVLAAALDDPAPFRRVLERMPDEMLAH